MEPEIPPTIYGTLAIYQGDESDLPMRRFQLAPTTVPTFTSCWRPSEAELLELVSGGCIIVRQRGTVAPISLHVEGVG